MYAASGFHKRHWWWFGSWARMKVYWKSSSDVAPAKHVQPQRRSQFWHVLCLFRCVSRLLHVWPMCIHCWTCYCSARDTIGLAHGSLDRARCCLRVVWSLDTTFTFTSDGIRCMPSDRPLSNNWLLRRIVIRWLFLWASTVYLVSKHSRIVLCLNTLEIFSRCLEMVNTSLSFQFHVWTVVMDGYCLKCCRKVSISPCLIAEQTSLTYLFQNTGGDS